MPPNPQLLKQLEDAATAHAAWKTELRRAVAAGTTDRAPHEARRDHLCAFGAWLYSGCDAATRATPDYRAVKDLHAHFHDAAARVLQLVRDGRLEDARREVETGSTFAMASAELARALNAWMRK